MCEICEHKLSVNSGHFTFQVNAYDPTRTKSLRDAFVRDMNSRFNYLIREIRKAIVDEDVFGLKVSKPTVFATPGENAFKFERSQDKVKKFMDWLQREVDAKVLEVRTIPQIGSAIETPWTNKYIYDSYKRGVIRSRYELRKSGYDVAALGSTTTITATLGTPFHLDRVGLLYTRTFQDLKGITAQMDTQISRILAQGIADGDGPRLLARKLVATIQGGGEDLGLTDTIGRYIPAKRRAEILARTEMIRAHHAATIQEYRNWGVPGATLQAEFVTAGDDRVCQQCKDAAASGPYTLDQIEPMIPLHPQCRCLALPLSAA